MLSRRRYTGTWDARPLFVALILLLLLYPYLEGEELFLKCLVLGVLLGSLYSGGRHRYYFVLGCILGAPALILSLLEAVMQYQHMLVPLPIQVVVQVSNAGFMGLVTANLLWHVLSARQVTANTLYSAACVYLLSGLAWTSLYILIEIVQPTSFHLSTAQDPHDTIGWPELLFYSYATLTTLGYGDITPVSSPARSLALLEAVFGVLYNAILIARLVGLYQPTAATSPQA